MISGYYGLYARIIIRQFIAGWDYLVPLGLKAAATVGKQCDITQLVVLNRWVMNVPLIFGFRLYRDLVATT